MRANYLEGNNLSHSVDLIDQVLAKTLPWFLTSNLLHRQRIFALELRDRKVCSDEEFPVRMI